MTEIKEKLLKIESLKQELKNEEEVLRLIKEKRYNDQICDISPQVVLQEQSDVFMTSENKLKLHVFTQKHSWLVLDLVYEKTNTYCFQVKMDKDVDFYDYMTEISPFLPYLVSVPNLFERPFCMSGLHIKIVDKFIGDDGSISIIRPDHTNEIWVTRTYDGMFTIINKFDNFESALYFCYEKYAF